MLLRVLLQEGLERLDRLANASEICQRFPAHQFRSAGSALALLNGHFSFLA